MGKRRNWKTLVTQSAQAQILREYLITELFKVTLTQILYIQAYLTLLGLKLDQKTDYMGVCLHFRPFYHILTQGRFKGPKQIQTSFEFLKKWHQKHFFNNICKLIRKPANIIASWLQLPCISILN